MVKGVVLGEIVKVIHYFVFAFLQFHVTLRCVAFLNITQDIARIVQRVLQVSELVPVWIFLHGLADVLL